MLAKEKRDELVRIYLQHGRRAIRPLCVELGISPQTIANHASNRGLARGRRGKDDSDDPRWARARAIGKVVA